MRVLKILAPVCALALLIFALAPKTTHGQAQVVPSYEGPIFAADFAHWIGRVQNGPAAGTTGSYTIQMVRGYEVNTRNVSFVPYSVTTPITIGVGSSQETVTPTAVSGCGVNNLTGTASTCNITATFANTHGPGSPVFTGDFGLEEAIQFLQPASASGGGQVMVDQQWYGLGATGATITGAVVYPNVSIQDISQPATQYWNPMSNTTVLATPTALTSQAACDSTHQFCSDGTVAGSASWGGTVHGCVTYVDVMGNESLCSTDASFTSVASKAIDVASPAASAGAVGWRLYLSTSGGTYAQAFSIPLLTQPTVLLAVPLSANVCTLEYISPEPACAIANTTYGETTSTVGKSATFNGGAQVTGYPVVTSVLNPNLDSASSQQLNPQSGGHTVYKYTPSNHVGIPGVMTVSQTFPITTAAQSTIGQVAGTIKLPSNFMNYVGRSVEVCGMLSKTSTNADTITNIQLWWDAEGSNVTAGTAVQLSNIQLTLTNTAAATYSFCQDITTTVAAASATGGTITPGSGWMDTTQVAAGTVPGSAANSLFAAVGSLNLALPANLEVVYNHTTGTDGAGVLLVNPTIRILN